MFFTLNHTHTKRFFRSKSWKRKSCRRSVSPMAWEWLPKCFGVLLTFSIITFPIVSLIISSRSVDIWFLLKFWVPKPLKRRLQPVLASQSFRRFGAATPRKQGELGCYFLDSSYCSRLVWCLGRDRRDFGSFGRGHGAKGVWFGPGSLGSCAYVIFGKDGHLRMLLRAKCWGFQSWWKNVLLHLYGWCRLGYWGFGPSPFVEPNRHPQQPRKELECLQPLLKHSAGQPY